MTRDKFTTALTELKNRKPFHPFTVSMVNGDRLVVRVPESLELRDGSACYFTPGSQPHFFDHKGVSQLLGEESAAR
jgi:hypothetical protein